jgi:hypothetical protein
VAVERREEVLHGGWLRRGRRRRLGFGRHRDVVRSGCFEGRKEGGRWWRRREARVWS